MLRNVLDIMQRNKTLQAPAGCELQAARAGRSSAAACRSSRRSPKDFIDSLRSNVDLVRYNKGDVICRQGDVADAFYLVRIGFVKVSEDHREGELVLAYLGPRRIFRRNGTAGRGPRTATCTALDHVEVVRIHADDFQRMMESFPDVRRSLEAVGPAAQRNRTGSA